MDSFFDFIFGNFFIVIIIVVGLINLFSKGKQANDQTRERQERNTNTERRPVSSAEREQPKSLSEVLEQKVEQAKETFQQASNTYKDASDQLPKSIEEQRAEQYEELRRRMQTPQTNQQDRSKDSSNLSAENKVKDVDSMEQTTPKDLEVAYHLQRNLTREGLAESIVMAEVLGPPRALNPYRNVAAKRRK